MMGNASSSLAKNITPSCQPGGSIWEENAEYRISTLKALKTNWGKLWHNCDLVLAPD